MESTNQKTINNYTKETIPNSFFSVFNSLHIIEYVTFYLRETVIWEKINLFWSILNDI